MYVLGLSAYYHDSAAALIRDGVIVAAAQEDRFTRKKHDPGFPVHAVRYCLANAGITMGDVALVAFYDKPWLKFERIVETYVAYAPRGLRSFFKAMPVWLKDKMWMRSHIAEHLEYDGRIVFPEHHESHAASAYYPSPFGEAAILTIDGVGEWATASFGVGHGREVDLSHEIRFPHSLGLFYSAFTYYTGFKVNSAEYKVMGLAPYGEPKYVDVIKRELIDIKEDGSFRLNMAYFNYCSGLTMTSQKFHDLFGGPPRAMEGPLTRREMDIARSLQEVTEEIVLKMGRHIRRETGLPHLCLAGGVALNCVANGRLLRERTFDDIWIQPAAGDAGGALGAALIGWHRVLGNDRSQERSPGAGDAMSGSFLGPAYSDPEITRFLETRGLVATRCATDEVLCDRVADVLAEGKVVGWFQGRMEFGPRALGSRSILGDPRSATMRSLMNLKIKYRESFRPFAPAVLRERLRIYFDMDHDSPYMLLVAHVVPERRIAMTERERSLFGIDQLDVVRSDVPAVTHVDYSARIQTVHRDTNPIFHQLLSAFERKTGCGVLVNTSFNVRGEPIVCSPEDAYRCFMRTEMDVLVLGAHVLLKQDQTPTADRGEWKREFALD